MILAEPGRDVDVALLQLDLLSRGLRDVPDHDPLDLCGRSPVVGIALQHNFLTRNIAGEYVGAGAGGAGVEIAFGLILLPSISGRVAPLFGDELAVQNAQAGA